MSDESNPAAEEAATEVKPTPKVRRISNKNPRKAAKSAKEAKPVEQEVPVEEFDSSPPTEGVDKGEIPEASGDPKRKNRRRRGKGKSSQNEGEPSDGDSPVSEETTINLADADSKESSPRQEKQGGRRDQQKQRPAQKQRPKFDSDKVSKNAWKIFLAEVSEEGVALIGDNDARELARRCFRLSEIFLEEESRRN